MPRLFGRNVASPASPSRPLPCTGRRLALGRVGIVRAHVNPSPDLGEELVRQPQQRIYATITQAVMYGAPMLFGRYESAIVQAPQVI